jgi:hypothetical protein
MSKPLTTDHVSVISSMSADCFRRIRRVGEQWASIYWDLAVDMQRRMGLEAHLAPDQRFMIVEMANLLHEGL